MYHELVQQHAEIFDLNLREVPEVNNIFPIAQENPGMIARTFVDYLRVVRHLANLTPDELTVIASVNAQLGRKGADRFIQEMGKTNLQDLTRTVAQASDIRSPAYQGAINELSTMMTGGHQMKIQGTKPKDGVLPLIE